MEITTTKDLRLPFSLKKTEHTFIPMLFSSRKYSLYKSKFNAYIVMLYQGKKKKKDLSEVAKTFSLILLAFIILQGRKLKTRR